MQNDSYNRIVNILDKIIANKRCEFEANIAKKSLATIRAEAEKVPHTRKPFRALFAAGNVLIAEVKPKSPSVGTLIEASPLETAEIYAESSADAISVLTDEKYFGGSLELLEKVSKIVPQPLLRKDFIIDAYQVYETALTNASAFLLIAAVLSADEMRSFRELGKRFGLDTITEIHTAEELLKALESGADLIGINNRNLQTLDIDLVMTETLAPGIPASVPFVSESGIENAEDVRRVRGIGARGILVGTSILRSQDPLAAIRALKLALS